MDAAGNVYVVSGTQLIEYNVTTHQSATLASFNSATGSSTLSNLVIDAAGDVFGTTTQGGANGYGTVFEYSATTHALTALDSFSLTTGVFPAADLIPDASGNLFGVTLGGGSGSGGSVFEYTASTGKISEVAPFTTFGGGAAHASLIADAAGNLYHTGITGGSAPAPLIQKIAGLNVTSAVSLAAQAVSTIQAGTSAFVASFSETGSHEMMVTLNSDADFATGSSVQIVNGQVVYTAGSQAAVTLNTHHNAIDTITYTVTDMLTGESAQATNIFTLTAPAGITLTGNPYGGSTLVGNGGNDIINAYGDHNSIDAGGGDDTISGGNNFNTVNLDGGNSRVVINGYWDTVIGADGNNQISGGVGNETITLGNGNNTISAGGYDNTISVGRGINTIYAGVGSDTVTIAGGTATVTAGGYGDVFNIGGGTVTLGGWADYATINLGAGFTGAASVDLTNFTGTLVNTGGIWQLLKSDGEVYATVTMAAGVTAHLVSDGHGGETLVTGAPVPPTPPVHLIETASGQNVTLSNPTNWLTLVGSYNAAFGGSSGYIVDGGDSNNQIMLGNGTNVVTLGGYGNTISVGTGTNTINAGPGGSHIITIAGGTATVTAGGYYNRFAITGGNVSLSGMADYATISLGANFTGGATLDLPNFTGTITETNPDIWQLKDSQGLIYATVSTLAGMSLHMISDGHGGEELVPGAAPVPPPATTILEISGGQSVAVTTATTAVTLVGYNNTVTGAGGTLSIQGDQGGSTFNLTSGNNTLVLGGYNDRVNLDVGSSGDNTISGSQGGVIIVTGDGNQTITTGGYNNQITVGNGNSHISGGDGNEIIVAGNTASGGSGSITAGGYNNQITAGSGNWAITAGAGSDRVTAGAGHDSITLSGWYNVVTATTGVETVTGGAGNTYALSGNGQFVVTDFDIGNGDVLNLHALLAPMGSSYSIWTATNGNALDVYVTSHGATQEVAILSGLAVTTTDLFATHSIVV